MSITSAPMSPPMSAPLGPTEQSPASKFPPPLQLQQQSGKPGSPLTLPRASYRLGHLRDTRLQEQEVVQERARCLELLTARGHGAEEVPGGTWSKVTRARRVSADQEGWTKVPNKQRDTTKRFVGGRGAQRRTCTGVRGVRAAPKVQGKTPDIPFTTLWVGNISATVTPSAARKVLGEYGTVRKFKGPSQRQAAPYFVFVTYAGPMQAQGAMCAILRKNYVGAGLGGVRVEWADPTQNGKQQPTHLRQSYPSAWCFWFDGDETAPERDTGKSSSAGPWQPMKLGAFTDQQGFWRVSRGLPTDGNIRLFRDGVHPSWEHKANMGGGSLMMRVRKDECAAVWSDLLSCALLESLGCAELIVGIVMSRRRQDALNDTISVWLGRHSPEQSASIVDHLRHQLKLRADVSMYYKPHYSTRGGSQSTFKVLS